MSEATSYDIDNYVTDHDLMIECMNELKSRYYEIFLYFESGSIDKISLTNTNKVYQYNKNTDDFVLSDLIYNPEEDYCLLRLNSVIDEAPDFTYDFLYEESLSQVLKMYILDKVYYRRKFKKLQENITDDVEIIDQGIEQV